MTTLRDVFGSQLEDAKKSLEEVNEPHAKRALLTLTNVADELLGVVADLEQRVERLEQSEPSEPSKPEPEPEPEPAPEPEPTEEPAPEVVVDDIDPLEIEPPDETPAA